MSQDYSEGGLIFSFPDGWQVCRPGETFFYKMRFQHFSGACKEMDFTAYDPLAGKLWLLEVKDYAVHARTRPTPLQNEVAQKTRDTLALLSAAAVCDLTPSAAGKIEAGEFARASRAATSLGIVLHCEPQAPPSALFPAVSHMANLLHALRNAFKAFDGKVTLARKGAFAAVPWTVA